MKRIDVPLPFWDLGPLKSNIQFVMAMVNARHSGCAHLAKPLPTIFYEPSCCFPVFPAFHPDLFLLQALVYGEEVFDLLEQVRRKLFQRFDMVPNSLEIIEPTLVSLCARIRVSPHRLAG